MFEISIKSHFSGAHHLKGYAGACSKLHGHNWEVEIFIRGSATNEVGMLVDFARVKTVAHGLIEAMDHCDLNALPAFSRLNPTSEHIARYLFQELSRLLNTEAYRIHRIRVSETPGTCAEFWEE
ncbi:MAG: 6-carboxytetrahydropterin synthase QueD [Lentisphaerae bacterium]|nr:6-carboxytetrahydropterin synthase QueD [Lentisphaerota bacterium]